VKLENVTLNDLGRAQRVTITKRGDDDHRRRGYPADMMPVKHCGCKSRRPRRVRSRESPRAPGELVGGVAVITVGAVTEAELKRKKRV